MAKEIPAGAHVTRVENSYRSCGKPTCGCHTDKSKRHGPYLYLYWRENGVLKSKYGGKWEATEIRQEG